MNTFDDHLNEKYGDDTQNVNQTTMRLSPDDWIRVNLLRDNGYSLTSAIESIHPELYGEVWIIRSSDDLIIITHSECSMCDGLGVIPDKYNWDFIYCPNCDGTGSK